MNLKKAVIYFVIFCFFCSESMVAQKTMDSSITFPMFSASYMVQFPGGDMAKRYGVNSNIGGSFMLKLKNNFLFEINASYLFGNVLKGDASTIFDSIITSTGGLINEYGEYGKVRNFERGYFIGGRIGYILPFFNSNPNSGPLILLGGGILQHKIRIENEGNNTPQILNEYKKGYDKMCYGFSASEFIGYIHFSKSMLTNFYIGVELYQGWTRTGRSYDFTLMRKDTQKRMDLLTSIKVGWIIPIYKRVPEKYYFY